MRTLLCFFAFLCLASGSAFAQQSVRSQGYQNQNGVFGGAGGGGGGFGGRSINFVSADSSSYQMIGPNGQPVNHGERQVQSRPETDGTEGLWATKTAILTPGDHVEFKILLEKGEVLLSAVESTAFDPGLSIELGGKVLKKNDDRSEGDQAPFLNFRAPQKGEYLLKVLSFRSAAGGQFTVRFRKLQPIDFKLGSNETAEISDEQMSKNRVVARVSLEKGMVVWLGGIYSGPRSSYPNMLPLRIISPSGAEVDDYDIVYGDAGSNIIDVKTSGDYLFEYYSIGQKKLGGTFQLVPRVKLDANGESAVSLPSRSRALVETTVNQDDILRTTIVGAPTVGVRGSVENWPDPLEGSDGAGFGTAGYGAWFRTNFDSNKEVVRSFNRKGTLRVLLTNYVDSVSSVKVVNTTDLPEWKDDVDIASQFKVGDSPIFIYRSKFAELVRLKGEATTFLPMIQIFNRKGGLENQLGSRVQFVATDDLYFPRADTYLVRLSAIGNSSAGLATFKKTPFPATPYTLGSIVQTGNSSDGIAVYSANLIAGKRYEMLINSPYVNVDLIDDQGAFLPTQSTSFNQSSVRYFVPDKSGLFRLWVRNPISYRFVLREFSEPKIEDAAVKG